MNNIQTDNRVKNSINDCHMFSHRKEQCDSQSHCVLIVFDVAEMEKEKAGVLWPNQQ